MLRQKLLLADDELKPNLPPHPEALRWAIRLWPERLVGGLPRLQDDPPVIVAIAHFGSVMRLRAAKVLGLSKLAVALGLADATSDELRRAKLTPNNSARLAFFKQYWCEPDERLVRLARLDLATAKRAGDRILARLGLITAARLLSAAEPYRVRWALQHVPYPVAKYVRSRMGLANPLLSASALLAWETAVFAVGIERLRAEDRLGGRLEGLM
jgi:hypothetical protein